MSCCSTPANAPTAGAVAQVRGFGSPVAMTRNGGMSGAVAQVRSVGFGAYDASLRGFGAPVAQSRGFGSPVAMSRGFGAAPRSYGFGDFLECKPWDGSSCHEHHSEERTAFITREYFAKWKVPICRSNLITINDSSDLGSDSIRKSIANLPPSSCGADTSAVGASVPTDPQSGGAVPTASGTPSWFNPGGTTTSTGIVPGGGFNGYTPPPSFLSTLPPWALPAGIGAGVLLLGGIVLALTRKPRAA